MLRSMARKSILVCDKCSREVEDNNGAVMRLTYQDARRGVLQADLCDQCAGEMPGRVVKRRGRRPQTATTA